MIAWKLAAGAACLAIAALAVAAYAMPEFQVLLVSNIPFCN